MEANRSDYDAQMHQDYGVDYDNGREVIITPLFYKMAKEQGTALTSFSRTWDRRLAYFANANYSYKGRYSFNVTGRYDGSNQLGKSRSARWLPPGMSPVLGTPTRRSSSRNGWSALMEPCRMQHFV